MFDAKFSPCPRQSSEGAVDLEIQTKYTYDDDFLSQSATCQNRTRICLLY